MGETPLLEVRDLSVSFPHTSGTVRAVRGISYTVSKGELLGIVGESGSGKSVSSLAIMGLLPHNALIGGDVLLRGESLLAKSDRDLSRLRGKAVAMIFQDPLAALTPVFTVGAQIAEGLLLHDRALSRRGARLRAIELLRVVGIPSPDRRVHAFPHEFSGGMRQRVMIAIAIANDPDLIIADEPTSALDVTIQAQILDVLQRAKEMTGAAVVLITHDLGVVAGHADRVAVMYAGRLVETGSVDDVFDRPRMPYTMGLLRSVPHVLAADPVRLVPMEGRPPSALDPSPGCPFEPRCPIATSECSAVEPPLQVLDGAHGAACLRALDIHDGLLDVSDVYPRPATIVASPRSGTDRETVLSVRDLVRHFPMKSGTIRRKQDGIIKAVDGIDVEIRQGEVLGLVGESGSGKTTACLEILELRAPQAGSIAVGGRDVSTLSKSERLRMRKDVQIVFQDPFDALDPRQTVEDIVGEPLTVHRVSRAQRRARVDELLDLVELGSSMSGRYPHELSGGQRQRVGIARALATEPRLLVLDEPVSALDVSVRAGILNLLEDLKIRLGLSYLLVAHDLAVVRQIADHVAVMYLGRIVETGPVGDVLAHPSHPYTQALLSAVPIPDPGAERSRARILLDGDLPSPIDQITGCNFHTRCPLFRILDPARRDRCVTTDPRPRMVDATSVACHHLDQTVSRAAPSDVLSTRENP